MFREVKSWSLFWLQLGQRYQLLQVPLSGATKGREILIFTATIGAFDSCYSFWVISTLNEFLYCFFYPYYSVLTTLLRIMIVASRYYGDSIYGYYNLSCLFGWKIWIWRGKKIWQPLFYSIERTFQGQESSNTKLFADSSGTPRMWWIEIEENIFLYYFFVSAFCSWWIQSTCIF